MARKKDFKISPLNPFAAAEAAATEILGIPPVDDEQPSENKDIANVDDVADVEQQSQHIQQNQHSQHSQHGQQNQHSQQGQQGESTINEQHTENSYVDDTVQQDQNNRPETTLSRADDRPPAKTPKRTFPGRQHMHLILPNELAEAVKLLAKVQNKSVNVFMTDLIETHMEDWKPIVDQLGRLDKNIGVKSSKKKLL